MYPCNHQRSAHRTVHPNDAGVSLDDSSSVFGLWRRYHSCGVPQQFTDEEIDKQLEQGEFARHMSICRCAPAQAIRPAEPMQNMAPP